MTVAGGDVGQRAVLEYLAMYGSERHIAELDALRRADEAREIARLERERLEDEQAAAEVAAHAPSLEERFAALEAEMAALRGQMTDG